MSSKKVSKTKVEIVLQGCYEGQWGDLCYYDRNQVVEAKQELRLYNENELGVPHRLIRRRIQNPEWVKLNGGAV